MGGAVGGHPPVGGPDVPDLGLARSLSTDTDSGLLAPPGILSLAPLAQNAFVFLCK